jgi:hypothetical protein
MLKHILEAISGLNKSIVASKLATSGQLEEAKRLMLK